MGKKLTIGIEQKQLSLEIETGTCDKLTLVKILKEIQTRVLIGDYKFNILNNTSKYKNNDGSKDNYTMALFRVK
jgi:hypothetical protein